MKTTKRIEAMAKGLVDYWVDAGELDFENKAGQIVKAMGDNQEVKVALFVELQKRGLLKK